MVRPARWMRWLVGPVLLGVAAVGIGVAVWPRPMPAFQPRQAKIYNFLVPAPVALAPGVYLLGKMGPAAAYLVETSQGLVLIDTGLENDARDVSRQITQLGFDIKNLKAILLTHVHADHSLGAEHLKQLTGARIFAGRADCPPLREGGPREAFFSTFSMPDLVPHPTSIDVEEMGEETLDFAETHVRVIAAPGHTPGSVCYLLERNGLRVLFTGDVIQSVNSANPSALGTYSAYLPPLYRGNAAEYLATLKRLRALPVPDLVLPGHPQMDNAPASPRLTAAGWNAMLDRGAAEMERLLDRYKKDGANFLDGHPKELLPGLRYLGDLGGQAVYCLGTAKGLYLFDAPGGSELPDFLEMRFKAAGWEGRKPVGVLLTSLAESATSGLAPLVERTGCQVVVAKAGIDLVRPQCPSGTRFLAAEAVDSAHWFAVEPIVLSGPTAGSVAYRVLWAGKTVLVSGRIPLKLSQEVSMRLLREVRATPQGSEQYARSLERLADARPAVWLPAVPLHGQNANIYDAEWDDAIAENRELLRLAP